MWAILRPGPRKSKRMIPGVVSDVVALNLPRVCNSNLRAPAQEEPGLLDGAKICYRRSHGRCIDPRCSDPNCPAGGTGGGLLPGVPAEWPALGGKLPHSRGVAGALVAETSGPSKVFSYRSGTPGPGNLSGTVRHSRRTGFPGRVVGSGGCGTGPGRR